MRPNRVSPTTNTLEVITVNQIATTDNQITPVPSQGEMQVILQQADLLAASSIVPQAYRRQPGNIVAAALMGRSFGWDAMSAMRFVQVIQGNATLKPEAMLALIRQKGHSVQIERLENGVRITGKRADTGDTDSVTFTVDDAKRAGLLNNGTWKSYPIDMCQWRAVSRIARSLFADVTLGAAYTPEELAIAKEQTDTIVEVDGSVSTVAEYDWDAAITACETSEQARDLYNTAARALAPSTVLDAIIARGQLLVAAEAPTADQFLTTEELFDGDVVDADLVTEGDVMS